MSSRFIGNTLFLAVLLALFFISGCKSKTGSPSPYAPNFLKIGNQWKYIEIDTTYKNALDTLTWTISGINGNGEYVIADTSTNQGISTNYWFMNGTSLMSYGPGISKSKATLLWKTDAKAGDTWQTTELSNTSVTENVQVIAQNVTDSTYAGIFPATQLMLTFSGISHAQYSYWSNDYGLLSIKDSSVLSLTLYSKNF